MRKISFVNGEYYNVFNRGVDKRKIFLANYDYERFLYTVKYLLTVGTAQTDLKLFDQSLAFRGRLSFICYCLMPNHYHLVIQQTRENAISDFMHRLSTSYTKYFNLNRKRTGRLFENSFKAVHISSEELLLHTTRYIHLNPLLANLTTKLETYPWSSYPDYIGMRHDTICAKEQILRLLSEQKQTEVYKNFAADQIDYSKKLKYIESVLIE